MSQSIYRSSVEFFPSVVRPQTVPSSTPNYALRRVVAGTVAAILVVSAFIAIGLLAGLGGRPASAFRAEPALNAAAAGTVHVAQSGDSLWSIAEERHGDVALDRYVDALISLNGGTSIEIGQAVRLP